MMDKNYLNYHVLISHSPSCLNRDDMNMQKSAIFGGKRRVRISSQSLKRAIRKSEYYRQHFGAPSIRTNKLDKIVDLLIQRLADDFDEAEIRFAAESFVKAAKFSDGDDSDGNQDVDAGTEHEEADAKSSKKLAVAPWAVEEMREVCRLIREVKSEGLSEKERESALKRVGKTAGKGKDKRKLTQNDCLEEALNKKIIKRLKEKSDDITRVISSALDIALSGRMATSGLMTSVDGAMAVAHAITTHSVDADIDWFTAVDDLVEDEGDVGAGHLNTQEFSAGVFYRYASLNIRQLQDNLGDVPRDRALEIGAHLLHLLATVVPTAKQQSFAAHNVADLAIASFSDVPLSLANAFESPIKDNKGNGFLKPSAQSLIEYWGKLQAGYGLNDRTRVFSLVDGVEVEGKLPTLAALKDWVSRDGQG